MRRLLMTVACVIPWPVVAQDAALVLGTERYEQLDRVRGGDDVLGGVDRLEALGFTVRSRANGRIDTAKDLAATFLADSATADRLVVALTGHFVTDGARSWVLTADAASPDLFSVDDMAVSVESVLSVLGTRPGSAVLVLGRADADDLELNDSALMAGVGAMDIPQGVTVLLTTPAVAANLIEGPLTEPLANLGQLLPRNSAVTIDGYFRSDWVLMPDEVIIEPVVVDPGPSAIDLNAEAALWDQTTAADTVAAYRTYVAQYPNGRFVEDAEQQIEAILSEPNRAARLNEEALGLNRAERRAVQAQLTALDFGTRGVDGIFGPGTRGAIVNWQQSNGFPQTSYLTREQINLLDAQAARRAAEIAAEETRARLRAEALDRSYWAETGAVGDEPGFRAYLARYPEGLFSNIATARLNDIEDRRRTEAETEDRAAWAIAQNRNVVEAYQEYLAVYPAGIFASQARARIEALSVPAVSRTQIERARAQEADLRLSGARAQLLELRLRDLGFNPGRLDGVIDTTTRQAISAYQEAQGITPTGYVDRATAVGLITGATFAPRPAR